MGVYIVQPNGATTEKLGSIFSQQLGCSLSKQVNQRAKRPHTFHSQ